MMISPVALTLCFCLCASLCIISIVPVESVVTFSSNNNTIPFFPRNLAACLSSPSSTQIALLGGVTLANKLLNDSYFSLDSGATWNHVQPLPNTSQSLPILPSTIYGYTYSLLSLNNNNLVVVGGLSNQPVVSSDNGLNWRYSNNGAYPLAAQRRAVTNVPGTNIIILTAGSGATLTIPRLNDVWISEDGAAAVWSNQTKTIAPPYSPYLTGAALVSLYGANSKENITAPIILAGGCIDPFCSLVSNTVYVSFDYGVTWPQQRNASWAPRNELMMAVDNDNFVYVVGGRQDTLGDLWLSTDIGLTWKQLISSSQYTNMVLSCLSVQQFNVSKQLVLFSGQFRGGFVGLVTACLDGDCVRIKSDSSFTSGLSGGSIFLIIFFTALLVYCAGGAAFNYFKMRRTGLLIIPNYEFWNDLPHLIKDGCMYPVKRICGLGEDKASGSNASSFQSF